jgi:Bacterial aa3 type cytochrome c oxidase subunit IV
LSHAKSGHPGFPRIRDAVYAVCRRLLALRACDTKIASKSADSQGCIMAVDPSGGHPAMDYPEHLRTYSGFLKATVILVVFCTGLLLFLLTLVP